MSKKKSDSQEFVSYSQELPAKIDALYLDTNVLELAWPALSNEIRTIATSAEARGISVYLPAVVVHELNEHWNGKDNSGRENFNQAYEQARNLRLTDSNPPELATKVEARGRHMMRSK